MIHVPPPAEPDGFETEVRNRGLEWLDHPQYGQTRRKKPRPESYWTHWEQCPKKLAEGFGHRCGYTASYTPVHAGNVDHFVSWTECKQNDQHALVYEWTNLRWLNQRVNQAKSKIDKRCESARLLDPFEVKDGWFELDLGRGVLQISDRVPSDKVEQARYTLDELDLIDGRIVEEQRKDALEDFRSGTSLDRIEHKHPLVARALRQLIATPSQELSRENRVLKQELLNARDEADEVSPYP